MTRPSKTLWLALGLFLLFLIIVGIFAYQWWQANEKLEKQGGELQKGRPDKAISRLAKSWLHSQLAIRLAMTKKLAVNGPKMSTSLLMSAAADVYHPRFGRNFFIVVVGYFGIILCSFILIPRTILRLFPGVKKLDPKGKAIDSLILGAIGLMAGLLQLLPGSLCRILFGYRGQLEAYFTIFISVSVLGLIFGIIALKSAKKILAMGGIISSLISLIILLGFLIIDISLTLGS